MAGAGLFHSNHGIVLLDVDCCDTACVLLNVFLRDYASSGSPSAVDFKSYRFGIGVFNHPVQKVLALVHIELVGVVVVANGDAVFLGELSKAVQLFSDFLGFLRRTEGGVGAGYIFYAKLGEIGQVLLDELQAYMGGNGFDAGFFQNLDHIPGRDAVVIPNQFYPRKPKFPSLAQLVQKRQPRVKAKGVNLQVDVVHGKHTLISEVVSNLLPLRSKQACQS